MKERGPKGERLLYAEQVNDAVLNAGAPQVSRMRGHVPRRPVKLAYTTTSSNYPAEGNKFEIIFLDSAYGKTEGQETPAKTDRQATPQNWVLNIALTYIPQDALIEVFQVNSQWYTYWSGSSQDHILGYAKANIPHGTSGEIWLAKGKMPNPLSTKETGTNETLTVWNWTNTMIWFNSKVVVAKIEGDASGWQIVEHYAATHIIGTAGQDIADGGNGVLYFVFGMDGIYLFSEAHVHVLRGSGDIKKGDQVIAEWDDQLSIWYSHGHRDADAKDKRVKVSADEPPIDANTGQYLEDQFENHVPFPDKNPFTDITIVSETVWLGGQPPNHNDEQVRWYWSTDRVQCWTPRTTEFLIHNGDQDDEPQWATSTPTAKFKNASCEKDLYLYHDWEDVSTCKEKKTFLKAASATDYSGCEEQVLGHDNFAVWKWYTLCEIEYVKDVRLNGTAFEAQYCTAKVLECGPCEWRTIFSGTPCGPGPEQPSESVSPSQSESSTPSESTSECSTTSASGSPSSSESRTESASESSSISECASESATECSSSSTSESSSGSLSESSSGSSSECGTESTSECDSGSASECETQSASDSSSESSSISESASESSSECDSGSVSESSTESSSISESSSESQSESTSPSGSTSESSSESSSGSSSVSESTSESTSESSSESNAPCPGCLNGTNPDTLDLTFALIGAGGDCTKCVSMNGTYTVTLNTYSETSCTYRYVDPLEGFNMTVTIGSSPPYYILVEFHFSDSNPIGSCNFENTIYWEVRQSDPWDCMNLNFPVYWDDDPGSSDESPEGCAGTGSSVLIKTGT